MATGLLALLDDVAAIAKVAAASIDDVMGQSAMAGAKAAGVVIDDAAVTPRYVAGFTPDRELPIVWRIALGSLRNKLLFLTPAALALDAFAPRAVEPLLMLGGVYLCYEGAEKALELIRGAHAEQPADVVQDAQQFEEERVRGAIRTDFILSAEIMTIALASIERGSIWSQAAILVLVGVLMTAGVYGGVALLVKMDDVGLVLARKARTAAARALGRALVGAMPAIMAALGVVGTAAMIWVGGGILAHGLAHFGAPQPQALVDAVGALAGRSPLAGDIARWLGAAAASGLFGLVVGAIAAPIGHFAVIPLARRAARLFPGRSG